MRPWILIVNVFLAADALRMSKDVSSAKEAMSASLTRKELQDLAQIPMKNDLQALEKWESLREWVPDGRTFLQQPLVVLNASFAEDLAQLETQLKQAYSMACKVTPQSVQMPCYGVGSSLIDIIGNVSEAHLNGRRASIIGNTKKKCKWALADKTKKCSSLFGCYLPSLAYSSLDCQDKFSTAWFEEKWSKLIHFAATTQFLLHSKTSVPSPELFKRDDCIAMQIRRGDACYNQDRHCHNYQEYLDAALKLSDLYGMSRLYLLTDAMDFPSALFQKHGFTVINEIRNNTKYNTSTFPEQHQQGLGNALSEVLEDILGSQQCRALVGQFSSSVTKLAFSSMITAHGMIPPFVSLGGCAGQALNLDWHEEC